MTENGPIPDVDRCFSSGANWNFFMTWGSMWRDQNDQNHVKNVYSHNKVYTLENINVWRNFKLISSLILWDGNKRKQLTNKGDLVLMNELFIFMQFVQWVLLLCQQLPLTLMLWLVWTIIIFGWLRTHRLSCNRHQRSLVWFHMQVRTCCSHSRVLSLYLIICYVYNTQ